MKTYPINQLSEGERFIIPNLKDTMRNLRVVRVSDCSTLIRGSVRKSVSGPWENFEHTVSNATPVIVDDAMIPDELVTVAKTRTEKVTGGKKGRKRIEIAVVIPDHNFTIKEFAKNHNISPAVAYLRVKELIQNKEIVEVERKSMGKGKPTVFFAKSPVETPAAA